MRFVPAVSLLEPEVSERLERVDRLAEQFAWTLGALGGDGWHRGCDETWWHAARPRLRQLRWVHAALGDAASVVLRESDWAAAAVAGASSSRDPLADQ